jgi:DNA-binding beta-propeller fold protein YncE
MKDDRPVTRFVVASAVALAACVAAAAPAESPFRILGKTVVGGEGGWDYLVVDAVHHRLFVTRSTRVSVFDLPGLKPAGEIAGTDGVHGVALAPEFDRGFTSNGRSNSVTVFELSTLKVLGVVKTTGENPDAILYDPASKRVFTFNGRSANATAIDAATGKVAGTIALPGKPEFATAEGKGRIFVNIEDKSEIVPIDSMKLTAAAPWPLAPCEEPSGMAIDRSHGRLFVGCGNRLMAVVSAGTGKVAATVPIGSGVDANGFDSEAGLAFSSNGEGTLTVVKTDAAGAYSLLQNLPTQRGARTMALDDQNHRIYLVTADFGPAPAATPDHPHPRPSPVPGTFVILAVGR